MYILYYLLFFHHDVKTDSFLEPDRVPNYQPAKRRFPEDRNFFYIFWKILQSLLLYTRKNERTSEQIFMKYGFEEFYEEMLRNFSQFIPSNILPQL